MSRFKAKKFRKVVKFEENLGFDCEARSFFDVLVWPLYSFSYFLASIFLYIPLIFFYFTTKKVYWEEIKDE